MHRDRKRRDLAGLAGAWRVGLSLLIAFSVFTVFGVIYILECAFYFFGFDWYFRLGPALHREEWQTAVPVAEAIAAIRRSLHCSTLRTFSWWEDFGFRRAWWQLSAYPRALLRVRESERGAILICEIRPFICMGLMAILSFGLLAIPVFRRTAIFAALVVTAVGIFAVYFSLWRREVRILLQLGGLRGALADIGVQVCDRCGYDLHGRDPYSTCPECGHVGQHRAAKPIPAIGQPSNN
jgi:hypothetical protein